jgi:hypothetical protein
MKKVILALSAVGVLAGCSSTEIDENHPEIMKEVTPEIVDAPPKVEVSVGNLNVPEWFLVVPEDQPDRIYAVGTGLSDDMQFSFDKALHAAKVNLADKIAARSTAQLKSYIGDNGRGAMGKTVTKSEKVSKSEFKNIDVSKYTVEERAVFEDRRMFRTYIQLSMDPQNRYVEEEIINTYNPEDEVIINQALDDI